MKNNFIYNNQKAGITLVEILVVVFLVSLFSGILIANFPRFQLQFSLDGAVHKFAQDVKIAQQLGGSGAQFLSGDGTLLTVKGYGVYVEPSGLGNTKYLLYADKPESNGNGSEQYNESDYILKNIDLSIDYPRVIIKEIHNANSLRLSINFKPPNSAVSISDLSLDKDAVEIIFGIDGDDSIGEKIMLINKLGLIEIK